MQDDTTTQDAHPTIPAPPTLSPKQFGSIRLIRQIGKGGMGEVWLARHELLSRDVAVKILLTAVMSPTDPAFTEFIQGAKVAASLEHPGLNTILHADVTDGLPYLVLDFLDGPNLHDLVAQSGPLDLPTCRAVIESVSQAVANLHQNNLLHRDLKPSNIILTTDGRIVITDFGLACARPATSLRDSNAGVSGTPAYMAPEMFDGAISARTDVYAIGMTAYHLLTGHPAFRGTADELRHQHLTVPIDEQPLRAAGVPDPIIQTILRATSREILFRPKTARHILDAFRAAFDEAGIQPASRETLVRLLKDRAPISPDHPQTSDAPSTSMAQTLAQFATRKRDLRDNVPRQASSSSESHPPIDPTHAKRRRAERWRIRLANIVAAIAGWCATLALAMFFMHINSWWQHLMRADDPKHTPPNWLAFIRIVVPGAAFAMVAVGIATSLYRLLRRNPLPQDTENTLCGWCQHELRGITTPTCSECGHQIGHQGPDEQGLFPLSHAGPRRLATATLLPLVFIIVTFLSRIPIEFAKSFVIRHPCGSIDPSAILMLLAVFPALWITLTFYEGFLQFDLTHSGRAWCRICKGELQNLTEPICPTCGSRI